MSSFIEIIEQAKSQGSFESMKAPLKEAIKTDFSRSGVDFDIEEASQIKGLKVVELEPKRKTPSAIRNRKKSLAFIG